MSYRQLARMPPATRSVHLVLAIFLKTHFAKDVFNRLVLHGSPGNGMFQILAAPSAVQFIERSLRLRLAMGSLARLVPRQSIWYRVTPFDTG